MALTWDLTQVQDRSVNFPPDEDGLMNDTVHLTIWWTIPVGIGHITAANADLFYERVMAWCEVTGDSDLAPTREQVHQLIGLHTNAAPRTDAEFAKVIEMEAHRQRRIHGLPRVDAGRR